ncbi:hypothetical protein [Brevibacillus daliensis]|uniref:hypothetical protein n=1 Tax=Brevibacillus daliensis TaxID=2892995 RepID=UPI001E5C87F3|nr:hypothetical protein [Brevibacillus daliensis]
MNTLSPYNDKSPDNDKLLQHHDDSKLIAIPFVHSRISLLIIMVVILLSFFFTWKLSPLLPKWSYYLLGVLHASLLISSGWMMMKPFEQKRQLHSLFFHSVLGVLISMDLFIITSKLLYHFFGLTLVWVYLSLTFVYLGIGLEIITYSKWRKSLQRKRERVMTEEEKRKRDKLISNLSLLLLVPVGLSLIIPNIIGRQMSMTVIVFVTSILFLLLARQIHTYILARRYPNQVKYQVPRQARKSGDKTISG